MFLELGLQPDPHPKRELFLGAYDKLVLIWADILFSRRIKEVEQIVSTAHDNGLNKSLAQLEQLLMSVSDQATTEAVLLYPSILRVVIKHKESVIWGSSGAPPPDGTNSDFFECFRLKIRRNIGQAYIEALVVLHSVNNYTHRILNLDPEQAQTMIAHSWQLVAHLATLHDIRQIDRLEKLMGKSGFEYPTVSFLDVISERYTIGAEHFQHIIKNGKQSIIFGQREVLRMALNSPTVGCPAHRLRVGDKRLNDLFWELLIQIYYRSGKMGVSLKGAQIA